MVDETPETISFELPGGRVVVNEQDLEAIRVAAINRLRTWNDPLRDQLVAELTGAMVWIDEEGVGRINQWLLERRGDHLALVRHPRRGAAMTFFVADLAKEEGAGWKVTALRTERVAGR
jgi:hypothetical protein